MVKLKLFLSQVIAAKGKEDNPDSSRYFNSFELINVKQ